MATTRSQIRRNNQQESIENVSEGLVSPIALESVCQLDQDACIAGPSNAKSPRVENSFLESLRASLKEEITSDIKNLLVESQKEMLRLLKPKTGENMRKNIDEEPENETRSVYTPTKPVRLNSTQTDNPIVSRNKESTQKFALINCFFVGKIDLNDVFVQRVCYKIRPILQKCAVLGRNNDCVVLGAKAVCPSSQTE